MEREAEPALAQSIVAIARPAIVRRIIHHPDSDGAELDIAVAPKKVMLVLHETGFGAPVPHNAI